MALGAGGAMALGAMGGSDAPDFSGQNAAALKQADLSAEQLAWAKQIYADSAPDRANATKRANDISDAQLAAMKKQSALTDDYAKYQSDTFRPLEKGIVADAQGYDTQARRDAAAGAALADVENTLATQRGATVREMERKGVNPSSGAAMSLANSMDLGAAALKSKAAGDARTRVETMGAARKMDAASLGRNLPSSQATSAGLALTQGNASAGNAQVGSGMAAQGAQILNAGYSGAQAGLAGAANTYGNINNLQQRIQANNSANDSATMGALGQVAGALFLSDKRAKRNVKPVSGKTSLKAIRKIPVSKWKYKDGAGDGGSHVGPMAQDVRASLGDAAAPGGTAIDPISMHGHALGAIKELDKRMLRLEHADRKAKR